MYRYIGKYRIDYDKKLKNMNYYGEPIVKQIRKHFIVGDDFGNTDDIRIDSLLDCLISNKEETLLINFQ